MSVIPCPWKYSASARVETVIPPGWPAIAILATSMDLAVFMCGRRGTFSRARVAAMPRRLRARIVRSSTRQGVGKSASLMGPVSCGRGPFGGGVYRQDRTRHVLPGETGQDRTGQAGRVDLHHVVMAEILVEPAAEVSARLHDDNPCRADIQPECLEKHRIGALEPVRHDHDGQAAHAQRGCLAKIEGVVGIDAPAASDGSLM